MFYANFLFLCLKDLIHALCYLWFPNIYITQDGYLAVTCWLTNTGFLICAYNHAQGMHILHYCYVTGILQLSCAGLPQVIYPITKPVKRKYASLV